ncbi:membrane protein RB9488 [Mucinivorans hirudinis]|uniref:Membrane protein RB9488 n=1 Tax=Mucinivorans hirudinis TaxID=1433126 RepID=A0A060RA47_9BACT|nr:membrane protein RB9488 [Mucinivorans hirudinis]
MKKIRTEDWVATILGLLIMVSAMVLGSPMVTLPKSFASTANWIQIGIFFILVLALLVVANLFLGRSLKKIIVSFAAIFSLSLLANYIASIPFIKERTGLESVFFAVAIGLLISNTVGTPKWLKSAVYSEFYVKIGLVLLGSTIIFGEVMQAGALGMVQALVVILSVWGFGYWIARKMGVDREMSTMLASAVSICGVSAAIATAGAIKGDSKKLSYVISLVLVCAIPMMYLMPYISVYMGLTPEVGGAWLGGTIDTTGAVVAAGSALGETGEQYAVIVKSAQNVLLGFAALAISLYWTYKGKTRRDRSTAGELWERFPKFVLGFLIASLVFSFVLDVDAAKAIGKSTKNIQSALFSIAFVCIGLETRFKDIFNKEFKNALWAFLSAQIFNIIVTLVVAYLLFNHLLFK